MKIFSTCIGFLSLCILSSNGQSNETLISQQSRIQAGYCDTAFSVTTISKVFRVQHCNEVEVVSVPFELAEGKFYFDKSLKLNWYQANEFCLSNKMVLATPDSPENDQRIRNFLRSYEINDFPMWISGNDLANTNTYISSSTGRDLNYKNFRTGEPNHFVNAAGETEHCIAIPARDGTNYPWNDDACSKKFNFICEARTVPQWTVSSDCFE